MPKGLKEEIMGCSPSRFGRGNPGGKPGGERRNSVPLTNPLLRMKDVKDVSSSDQGSFIRLGPLAIQKPTLTVEGVFPSKDGLSAGISLAAKRLGWNFNVIRSVNPREEVWDGIREPQFPIDLILIDYRQPKLISTFILDIVSFFEKSELHVSSLLEAGIDKVEVDVGASSESYWIGALRQIERSLVEGAYKAVSAIAILTALDSSRDIVQLTDGRNRIQYVNRAYEKVLGFSRDEVIGRDFFEVQKSAEESANDGESMAKEEGTISSSATVEPGYFRHPLPVFNESLVEELSEGKCWEGSYLLRRKGGAALFVPSRLVPFGPSGRRPPLGHPPSHTILLGETSSSEKSYSSDLAQEVGNYPLPRGSLKSLRKASYDVKSTTSSDGTRRTSLAKLHSVTIEAPITKVINILASAQATSPQYVANALESVLEILRTTELYSPHFFEEPTRRARTEDPYTADLLGALLSQGPRVIGTDRRSSSEANQARIAARQSLPHIAEAPNELQKLLECEDQWDFDIFALEKLTEKRPLVWLGMKVFERFSIAATLNTDEATLRNWLTLIEANYHSSNSYHNSTHAADVLQATAYFLSASRLQNFLEPMDEAIALLAAAVHDVDHPGKNSAFLSNTGDKLALLYNDLSVLESHHAALAFKLTLSDARVNIFSGLDQDTYKSVRKSLIDMVLATEMTRHFEHLAKFLNVFSKPVVKEEMGMGPAVEPDISTLVTPDNVTLVKRMLIKCADVANPTRPLNLSIGWAQRIAEEYFSQTDEEIKLGLPPVMPFFERKSCSIPKSQTGFVDYFVADMMEAWDAFIDVPDVIDHMKKNYDYWKDLPTNTAVEQISPLKKTENA